MLLLFRSAYLVTVLGLCLLVDFAIEVHVECQHLFRWPSNIFATHLVSCRACVCVGGALGPAGKENLKGHQPSCQCTRVVYHHNRPLQVEAGLSPGRVFRKGRAIRGFGGVGRETPSVRRGFINKRRPKQWLINFSLIIRLPYEHSARNPEARVGDHVAPAPYARPLSTILARTSFFLSSLAQSHSARCLKPCFFFVSSFSPPPESHLEG